MSDLWQIYYPGRTPEQAYWDARKKGDEWGDLYNALSRTSRERGACETEDEVAVWEKRRIAASVAVLRHSGIPTEWIDEYGHDCVPLHICRECWKPGAVDVDECGGCNQGYHPACFSAMSIRCDLRSVAWARIQGDEDRAQMWERAAQLKHDGGTR